jgi:formylglycine-generating enzyme
MLDKRLKWAFLIVALLFAGLPIAGIILDAIRPSQVETDRSSPNALTEVPSQGAPAPKEEMVLIPAGLFVRGYNGGGFDEKPASQIMVDGYWIDRFEVTYGDYLAFVTATNHRKPISRYVKHFDKLSAPRQPAVYVSWEDADEYCRYRGRRLPTEAEWEKAARGVQGFLWPWGNEDRQGWANTANADSVEFTAPVGSFSRDRSPFGLHDMGGNAMEWVSDWYQEDSYKDSQANPKGPLTGFYKVIRGASWDTRGNETRVTIRLKMIPEFRDTTIGFRCAKSATDEEQKREAKTSELYNKSK